MNNTTANNTDTTTTTYCDQQGSRDRRAWALLIATEATPLGEATRKVEVFKGSSIPGKVAVVASRYHKNGKWSNTTYQLVLAPGVRFLSGLMGWNNGSFYEGLSSATGMQLHSWADVANALGVTVPEAMAFMKEFAPRSARHFDEIDAALVSLDEADGADDASADIAELAISFGNPTNRAIREGYWSRPISIVDKEGVEIDTIPAPDYNTSTTGKVRVLEVVRSPGYHGGYVSLRVAAPEGSSWTL